MTTAHETALAALEAVMAGVIVAPASFERDPDSPVEATPDGVVVMRDGDPGEPELMISPLTYLWSREVEFEIIAIGDTRTDVVDALATLFATAIAADVTLGGAVDLALIMKAPSIEEIPIPDAQTERSAILKVMLQYNSSSGAG